jgi:hypothetical protein
MGKKSGSGSGMNNPDHIFGVNILKFFDVDPGSGMENNDSGSGIWDPGWKEVRSGINIPDLQHCVSVPYTGYRRLFSTSLFPPCLHKTAGSRFFLKISMRVESWRF